MYIDTTHLQKIINHKSNEPLVSIYLPTHPISNSSTIQQDQTRLKNAIQHLASLQNPQLNNIIDKLEQLRNDEEFWKHQDEALAIFASSEHIETIPLACTVPEIVHVDDSYVVSPLLLAQSLHTDAYVLDINLESLRLIHINGNTSQEVDTIALPTSMSDALNRDEYRNELQHQSTSLEQAGNAGVHGHDGKESYHHDIETYLAMIASATDKYLARYSHSPLLILAGTDDRTGNLRKKLTYNAIYEDVIQGSIENDSPQNIYEKARPLLNAYFEKMLVEKEQSLASTNPEMLCHGSNEVIDRAKQGNCEAVYVECLTASYSLSLPEDTATLESVVRAVYDQSGAIYPMQVQGDTTYTGVCRYKHGSV